MSVDNSSVLGMDYSALLEAMPNLWMVQWIEGKGEIEYQTGDGKNLNGLRENFIDIVPYAPCFTQFLSLIYGLTIEQAKKVKIDLINEIYNAKRQAPYHYPVAAGDYWWDATDASSAVNPAASLQTIISTLNTLINKVNALAGEINSIVVTQTNANIAAKTNVVITNLNNMVTHINSSIVSPGNSFISDYNTYTVKVLNDNLVPYVNTTLVGSNGVPANTLNYKLQTGTASLGGDPPQSVTAATPGLSGNIGIIGFGFPATGQAFSVLGDSFAGVNGIAGVNWSTMPTVGALPGGMFLPIGATVPVPLTSAEIAAIQNGIALRAQDLNVKRNTKVIAVNAMTNIGAVVVYDVTTGW
jgi:hypothetical protein